MTFTTLEAEGWVRIPTRHFSAAVGPIWMKGEPGSRTIGLLTDASNANDHMGTVHGGVLMTFADVALGCAVVDAISEPYCATIQLQFNFTASASTGSFVSCMPEIIRQTSQLVFVRGLFKMGERTIGSADGIWKILDPAKLNCLKVG